ncbi:hypothetical protein AGABI2DRAFT_114730 [Agaricus bisporus var. bisporus H97]|uniref:hypothetical protein n=1 Tax=Agaricus bisporus var. bisporus (strain H97 / ATCC MYA-4626 / FGSC 10389) TaxID=936046 RepID=UPI00029F78CA|nr:hypothetical protein AGABI2DRAFT_114730 [Agaricus bisporus var. bisporus H97]EKV51995.1 hypothetical protein AGABI2DRAFT_114730 [Agaricus bisporus var. bisporus H97]
MASASQRKLKRADSSTIQDKFLVGYQGWFTCAGDGDPVGPGRPSHRHHGWLHWFNFPVPDGGRPNTDLWPDVSSYSPSELFPAPGLKFKSGEQAFLFSSRIPKTVQKHFRWMAENGVDGAFLQRFAGQTDLEAGNEGIRRIRDEVGDCVREAAEKEGRVFAIMYDVSGVPADRIQRVLERDWAHLVREKCVLDSPSYLKEKGKPVIVLWGFGFDGAGHSPALLRAIVAHFRTITPGGVYVMAGTPSQWRTSEGDADCNPEFLDVWLNDFDAISPWTIGRYSNEQEADNFAETRMKGDVELIKKRVEQGHKKVDYIPVVFPGGSGCNLSEGKWGWNNIKRNGGRFLWKQFYNARKLGVRCVYGAMWDEYDEGTAFMPVVSHKRLLPQSDNFRFMALDEDGYDLPSDWYMRICGLVSETMHNERRIFETFPSKELQDYWANRPKYQDVPASAIAAGSSSSSAGSSGEEAKPEDAGQAYQEWLAMQSQEKEDAPPPPYSLEAEETSATTAPTAGTAAAVSNNVSAAQHTSSTSTVPPQAVNNNPVSGPSNLNNTATTTTTSPHSRSRTPTVNISTYPGQQTHGTGSSGPDPQVASLVNDFGRSTSLTSPRPHAGTSDPTSPHPAHSAASSSGGYFGNRPSANLSTRPDLSSSSGRPQSHQGYSSSPPPPQLSQQPQQLSPSDPSQWSQGQWPPPEWKVANPNVSYATYKGGRGGANLARPHTVSGPHSSNPSESGTGANLRPNATISGYASTSHGRPHYGSSSLSPSFPTGPQDMGPSAPSFSMHGGGHGPGGGSYPSPAPNVSTYPGQSPAMHYPPAVSPGPGPQTPSVATSSYPGQQPYYTYAPHHTSPPQSPPAVPSPYPPPPTNYTSYNSNSPPAMQPPHMPGPQFPHGPPGGYTQSGGPPFTGGSMPPVGGYAGGYYPSQDLHMRHGSGHYDGSMGFPQAHEGGPGPGSWMPSPGPSSPPVSSPYPPPPRPYNYPSSTGQSSTAPKSSTGPIGYALSAVEEMAGRKRRNQLQGFLGKLM